EEGIYYRVTPPKGVFFYIDKQDLAKDREVTVIETDAGYAVNEMPAIPAAPVIVDATTPEQPTDTAPADAAVQGEPETLSGDEIASADEPEMQDIPEGMDPSLAQEEPAIIDVPATPLIATRFAEVDAKYTASVDAPLEEQPLEELLTEYTALLAEAETSDEPGAAGIVPLVKARLATIEIRKGALDDLIAMQNLREQMSDRQRALQAEQEELTQRVERGNIAVYTAVGQLRPSSLQVGPAKHTLFRLVDPSSQRTVIYLQATGETAEKLMSQLDRFVGVRGDVQRDTDLEMKYVKVND
ncbi:MAG: hypothetical protein AAGK78_17110, partial [Planctomycetota bacterium]